MSIEAKVKCLVFDLDGTLWQGVLSEGGANELSDGALELIHELDRRGIIMSISSKNDHSAAMRRLDELGVAEYFLCPEINWGDKSVSLERIISELNIKQGAVAFIDDNPFERDQVSFRLPDVRTYDAAMLREIAALPEFTPRFITEDAANRRKMYISDMKRKADSETFCGSDSEFLATLGMKLRISRVTESELRRVEELTVRTHQLNSTGYTYSYEELKSLISSPDHIFLVASLEDKYGDSGKVGILLLEKGESEYRLKLLIVSCRVMSRGVGTALLIHAIRLAKDAGARLTAEFRETEFNRIMYITYKMMGFEDAFESGDELLLVYEEDDVPSYPAYLDIITDK